MEKEEFLARAAALGFDGEDLLRRRRKLTGQVSAHSRIDGDKVKLAAVREEFELVRAQIREVMDGAGVSR